MGCHQRAPRGERLQPVAHERLCELFLRAEQALQLAVDLGSGHSSLQLRLHRGINAGSPVGLRTMVACYLAALAAGGWGAWKLLRRR